MMDRAVRAAKYTALAAICAALVSACSGYKGTWPQLGPTAQDARVTMENNAAPAAAQNTDTSLAAPADSAANQDMRARLSQITASYADAQRRATLQRRAVVAAIEKVGGVADSSWSLAQLELSRLNQIDAELISLRADASGIAGDLAAMSARGVPVAQLVSQTGALINEISLAMDAIAQTQARARGSLSS